MITKVAEDVYEKLKWLDSMHAGNRAMRKGDTGINAYLEEDELVGKRYTKGLGGALKGGVIGAGSGGITGALTGDSRKALAGGAIGLLGGAVAGNAKGNYDADKEYLGSKGLRFQEFPKNLLGYLEANPKAKKKYLPEYK